MFMVVEEERGDHDEIGVGKLTVEGTSTQRNYDEDADIDEDNHEDCHHPEDDNYDNKYLPCSFINQSNVDDENVDDGDDDDNEDDGDDDDNDDDYSPGSSLNQSEDSES